jgi:hypothetical protein
LKALGAIFAIALAACASRAVGTSAAVASHAETNNESGALPKWSVRVSGPAVAIADGAVIVSTGRMVNRQVVVGVAAYDISSAAELWHRDGVLPVRGTPFFLADGQTLERTNARSGRVLWRSGVLCSQPDRRVSYVKIADASVYAGCDGGELFRLNVRDGRVLASQTGISVDSYQQLEALPRGMLAVAGYAGVGMYTRSAILHAQTLEPIEPLQSFTADLLVLGVRGNQAILADVCCRGTPDTNAPGAIVDLSLVTGDTLWSAAIRPYRPPLPLSDVEPGAGVFVLAGDRLYVGTRTALFEYRLDDLRRLGSSAPRRELYAELRDRPQVYNGRYIFVSEGKGAMVRRCALFDAVTARELWSDDSRPWTAPPVPLEPQTVAQMYGAQPGDRRFGLLRVSDGKMLPIDAGCYLQAANERYAVTLCGRRGRLPELALFDFEENVAASPSPAPAMQARQTPQAQQTPADPLLARWTQHHWNLIGETAETYFFGRDPNGIVAVSRTSGTVAWQNTTVCTAAGIAKLVNGILYVGCPETIAILDRANGRVAHKRRIGIYGFNAIVPAGDGAVVVEGWNDGAALSNDMAILDKNTLKPIADGQMTDSTFLGVVGDRAYVDDWCCFGRPDRYRPATIYSISLKDGSASEPIDLVPEPDLHPARMQPLGQGESNYLKGTSFYVVTPNFTYRYDVRNLKRLPERTVTQTTNVPRPR